MHRDDFSTVPASNTEGSGEIKERDYFKKTDMIIEPDGGASSFIHNWSIICI